MKLKLLFFMGILSVLFNTVSGQSNQPPFFGSGDPIVLRPPQNRVVCPGYTAANINYQTSDSNTFAEDLILNVSYVNLSGSQVVTFINAFETGGVNRTITVVPSFPYSESVVEVTISITDVGSPTPNLTSTAKFTVTFQDDVAPTFTSTTPTDNDVSLDGNCNFEVPDYVSLLTLTAVDDCGGAVSLAQSPLAGVLLTGGHDSDQLIVLTATDLYGNVASQSFTITLKDTTPPVVITQDITVSLDGTGNVMITPSQIDNGSNDNCSSMASLTYSLDLSSFTCADIGPNTVTLMVTDAVGNSATNTATVTVVDDIAPSITCPSDIAINNDTGDCGAIVSLGLFVSSDNCGVTATSTTRSDSLSLTDAYPVGVTTIIWTAEDSSGNISSCTQTVTVADNEDPVAVTQNIIVELDAMGNATISVSDIENGSTDNCGIVASLSMLDITSFTCANIGANPVVLTVEDAAGNTDTENATVTVVDLLKPVITPSANEDVNNDPGQCGALLTITAATAIDNCSPLTNSPAGVRSDFPLTLSDEYPVGTTTITWSVTDNNGNTASTTQTVTVNDVEAPTFSPLSDLILNNDDGFCGYDINQLTFPNASDNCGTTSSTTYVINGDPSLTLIPVSVGPDHVPSTIVWTATDGNGNTASVTQNVTVQDLELPVMRVQDISRNFDMNGQYVVTAEDIDNGSTDNSGETCFTKYVVDNIISCDEAGVHDVVLFGKDQWGNQHYAIAKVTVTDNTPPSFVEAALPALDFNTNTACTWVGILPIPATNDNCSVVSVTNDAPAAFDLGTTPVLWTVTDAAGNMATSTQDVTVTDAEKPVAIAKVGVIVELDTLGDATITALDIDNGSTDNCGIVASLSLVSPSTFTCANVGANVVTLTITDESGNVSTIDTVVTVVDNTVPALVTKPFTATLSGTGIVTVVASDVVDSSSDACGIKSTVVSPNTFSCANLGDNTVTVTVTDNNNNVTTATAVVTVEDDQVPTITVTDIEVDTNAGCVWTGTLGLPVTADNCSIVSVTSDKAIDFAYPVGDTDVLWTVTDAAGLTATATQTVTVNDSELPIAKATDITIKLSSTVGAGAATITVAQVNNGSSDNCGIKSVTISKDTFNCSNVGSNTVVLTVTDNSDNVSTANAIVTVVDDVLPVIAPVTAITSNTSAGICGANLAVTPAATATDNCTVGSPIGTRSDARALSATYPLGRTTITWNVTDANGNRALSVIQTVDVSDNEIPTITTTPITVDTNAGCIWTGTLGLPVTADNCTVASVTSDRAADFAYPVGTTVVTWTVRDLAGNSQTATQAVTVRDTEKPIAKANDFTISLNAAGSATITPEQVNNFSTDNCSVASLTLSKSSFNCSNVGENTVILTVTDANNNSSTVNATITVQDITPATVITKAYTLQLNAAGNGSIIPSNVDNGSNDACGIKSMTVSPNTFNCVNVGPNTVTLTVTDNNNNVSTATAIVTVVDSVLPIVITKPYTVQLNALGTASIVASDVNNGSNDACGIKSMTVSPSSFTCANVGNNTVTLTVTDNNNNVSTGTATVTVQDKIAPIVIAKSISVNLDAAGTVSITPAEVNDGSSDACGIQFFTLNKSTFNCSNIGLNSVILTATDVNGNVSLPTTVLVTVSDKVAPTVITKNIAVQLNVGGFATIVPADVNNVSTDACGIASYSLDKTSFNCSNVGANTVTLTVIDIHGNVNSATATVTISEPVKPIARALTSVTLQLNSLGTVSVIPADLNNGSTDNCRIVSYALSKSSFDCSNVGQNIVSLTATDASGNVSDPVQVTIIVQDKVAPVVVTQAYTAILNAAGTVTITPANVNGLSTDNCAIATYSISKSTFTCDNVGENIITLTVTDVNGNAAQGFATVNVVDNIAPVVVTRNIELVLVGDSVSITPDDVLVSATDACGVDVLSYRLSQDTFTIVDVLLGSVEITVYATDVNGNEGSATATITFPRVPAVANEVITPNGDGTNDTWVIDNITNHPNSIVKVYNTWGSLVFSATNYQNNWDGKLNGNDVTLPDGGSYYYQIDLDGNGSVEEQGWLYITRQ